MAGPMKPIANRGENRPRASGGSRPQFGLKALFGGVAVLSVLFAVATQAGFHAAAVLVMVVSLVVAHVAGNAIGTSRRNRAPDQASGQPPITAFAEFGVSVRPLPPSELRQSIPLNRRVVVAAACGAALGSAAIAWETYGSWGRLGAAGAAIVATSGAVLGAYVGFMASRFTAAFGRAWRQAHAHSRR
jgi:hypothetical protein